MIDVRRLATAAIASTIALSTSPSAASADSAFSQSEVFSLPGHKIIDDRCSDARSFADKMADPSAVVDPQAAVDGAKGFARCAGLRRLNPDPDEQRYYVLGAATALYMAAGKVSPVTALSLYANADGFAQQLGGLQPDPMYSFIKVQSGGGRSYASEDQQTTNVTHASEVSQGPAHSQTIAERNTLTASGAPPYTDVASSLRIAIAKGTAAAKAAAAPASATPAAVPSSASTP